MYVLRVFFECQPNQADRAEPLPGMDPRDILPTFGAVMIVHFRSLQAGDNHFLAFWERFFHCCEQIIYKLQPVAGLLLGNEQWLFYFITNVQ